MTEAHGRMTVVTERDGHLSIGGMLDETSGLLDLLGRAANGKLVLDLAGVTFINSLGVRDWIRMQMAATKSGVRVEMRQVSEPVVHQLNMIVATRGTGSVISFFAPYACDACGREESRLVDAVANAGELQNMQPPPMACPECGQPMAFNDFPERFFSFLAPPS
jgi:eukaryotic-like serine/threonine-protein kinase